MKSEFDECIDYIDDYWEKLTEFMPNDSGIHIGLSQWMGKSTLDCN